MVRNFLNRNLLRIKVYRRRVISEREMREKMNKEKEEVQYTSPHHSRTLLTTWLEGGQGEEGSRGEGSEGGMLRLAYPHAGNLGLTTGSFQREEAEAKEVL